MVNEETISVLQVMRSGFALDEPGNIDRVDDLLEQRLSFAFSEEFGYLTACPTNVGTACVPASCSTCPPWFGQANREGLSRLAKDNLRFAASTARAAGRPATFTRSPTKSRSGKSETTILGEIRDVIPQIITYERQARTALLRESRQALQDRFPAHTGRFAPPR